MASRVNWARRAQGSDAVNLRRFWSLAVTAAAMAVAFVNVSASPATAGSAVIGGKRMSCYAAEVVITDKAPGPGFAVAGQIIFNPKFLGQYPPLVQRLCVHSAQSWRALRARQPSKAMPAKTSASEPGSGTAPTTAKGVIDKYFCWFEASTWIKGLSRI